MDNLYVLYLNNTVANPELATLLGYTPEKKIIFQFFHDVSNALTLDAWPRVSGGTYNYAHSKLLHISNLSDLNISTKAVHLGNCHLNVAECNSLLAVVNQSGYEFILFYPYILNVASDGTNHIIYKIYGNSTMPMTMHDLLTGLITSTANPSPPRPAGEA